MFRRIGVVFSVGAIALGLLFAGSASATSQRVKGKFITHAGSAPAVGNGAARPMGANVWRVHLQLQHVNQHYLTSIGNYTDANGNGRYDAGEETAPLTPVPACNLSHFTKKGHTHCGRADVTLTKIPNVIVLTPVAGGAIASATLKG